MIIYKAENLINGKVYIGQTIRSLKDRMKQHRFQRADGIISRAIKQHGIQSFVFITIDTAMDRRSLNQKEKYWITYYNSKYPNGYNLTDGGDGTPGHKVSDETKYKLRLANKGKSLSAEHRLKISIAHKGKGVTKEARLHMSLSHRGIPLPETTKKKMGIARSGDKNGSAKLTWGQVREIRELYKQGGYTLKKLGDLYQVGLGSIHPIIHNKSWVEVNG